MYLKTHSSSQNSDSQTHLFDHQINVVEETHKFLKKGGFLIREDVFVKKKKIIVRNYIMRNLSI